MAGLKEIKRRLRSVTNTRKITYAMQLVSAAKLRKVQEAVTHFHAYSNQFKQIVMSLKPEVEELGLKHPLMERRAEVKNVCLVIIGGQRGLCGAYNTNMHKRIELEIKKKQAEFSEATLHFVIIGKKVAEFFRRTKRTPLKIFEDWPDNSNLWPIEQVRGTLEKEFLDKVFDEVWVLYTQFKSAISHSILCERLLPIAAREEEADHDKPQKAKIIPKTIFEPSLDEVFAAVMPRILSTWVRQSSLDAQASETASRMTAMDAATKNAAELAGKLELMHNKVRQLRITSELLDIVGGAEAIK